RRVPRGVQPGLAVAGEKRDKACQKQGAGRRTSPLPQRGGRCPGVEEEVTPIGWENKAAGGVLTARQAPHRPGTAPALGLRAGSPIAPIVVQTATQRRVQWLLGQ